MILLTVLSGCASREDHPCAVEAPVRTIDDALDTIDELPRPVTLDCFLIALERPLGVVLTSDVFNTQPAQGHRSPRILVRADGLTMTAVPVGEAKDLLEFGEARGDGLTVKAEIAFPVDGELPEEAAFERTLAWPGADHTGCNVCHPVEIEVSEGRFANTELRPPDGMVVPLEVLRDEHAACDPDVDADRCARFSALLDHGAVYERPFDASVATQFAPPP